MSLAWVWVCNLEVLLLSRQYGISWNIPCGGQCCTPHNRRFTCTVQYSTVPGLAPSTNSLGQGVDRPVALVFVPLWLPCCPGHIVAGAWPDLQLPMSLQDVDEYPPLELQERHAHNCPVEPRGILHGGHHEGVWVEQLEGIIGSHHVLQLITLKLIKPWAELGTMRAILWIVPVSNLLPDYVRFLITVLLITLTLLKPWCHR